MYLKLTDEVHVKFRAYCASQNRSMQKQLEFMIERLLDPAKASPVISLHAARNVTPSPVVVPLKESDVRRIVRHELSYLMPDQYERRYGKGEPS
jgi:hypothetical protein